MQKNTSSIKSLNLFVFSLILSALLFSSTGCQTKAPSEVAATPEAKPIDSKIKELHQNQRNSVEFKLNIPYRSLDTSKSIETFGFGSCNHQDLPQPLWPLISQQNPQLFIMMGDNVYASAKETKPIVNQYLKLNENQDYRSLREKVPFLAIWDDHDYGQNDGGATNLEKDEARRLFLNYWGHLKQTLPRKQMALYHSRTIGKAPRRVQVILLDTRWDRSDLVRNPDYNAEAEATTPPIKFISTKDKSTRILSEEQWSWLEEEIKKPAELKILVSSIQVIAENPGFEKWANFPHEKQRLMNLLKKNKAKNLVILSGDRHLSVVSKASLGSSFDLYELTASSLNSPARLKLPETDPTYASSTFLPISYGLGKINWMKRTLTLEIRDVDDKVQITQDIKF